MEIKNQDDLNHGLNRDLNNRFFNDDLTKLSQTNVPDNIVLCTAFLSSDAFYVHLIYILYNHQRINIAGRKQVKSGALLAKRSSSVTLYPMARKSESERKN